MYLFPTHFLHYCDFHRSILLLENTKSIIVSLHLLARSPRRSTGDKSGLCIWNLCLFVCLFVCLIVLGKFSNYSPHPPLFPLFIVLSPLLFISKIFSVMIKNETSWEWIPMYGPLGGRWTVRVGGGWRHSLMRNI